MLCLFILHRSYSRWPVLSHHNRSISFKSIFCWFIQAWSEQSCLCIHGNHIWAFSCKIWNNYGNQCYHIEKAAPLGFEELLGKEDKNIHLKGNNNTWKLILISREVMLLQNRILFFSYYIIQQHTRRLHFE